MTARRKSAAAKAIQARKHFDPVSSLAPMAAVTPDVWETPGETSSAHAVACVDEARRKADLTWGLDRLPRIVSVETAARFGDRLEAWERARAERDHAAIRDLSARLVKAHAAMDREARALGHEPVHPQCWPIAVGKVAALICPDDAEPAVRDAHQGAVVYSFSEAARLIGLAELQIAPAIAEAKGIWPGAKVVDIRPMERDPQTGAPADLLPDDEIPF